MKNTIVLLVVIAAVALGVVCLKQRRQITEHKTQLTTLHQDLDEKSQQVQELQTAEQRAASEREELRRKADEYAAKVVQAQQSVSTSPVPALTNLALAAPEQGENASNDMSGFGKMLSKMMDDPEMKKMIQNQQRMMVDQMYNPLIKQLGLPPDEAAKLKDLIANSQMKATEQASSLMNGSPTNRAEAMAAVTEAQKSSDDQIKQLLGDAQYAQYKDYQLTMGERTMLNQFKQQNADSANALSDQQTEQLLTFMKEEKQNVAAATGQSLTGADQTKAGFEAMASPEQMDKFLQVQEETNQRVYDRAKEVLSPDQLQSFAQFQTNQLQMMRMGMTMARKMFATGKADAGSPPPSQ